MCVLALVSLECVCVPVCVDGWVAVDADLLIHVAVFLHDNYLEASLKSKCQLSCHVVRYFCTHTIDTVKTCIS